MTNENKKPKPDVLRDLIEKGQAEKQAKMRERLGFAVTTTKKADDDGDQAA